MYKNIDEAMIGLSVWKKNRRNVVKPISNNIVYKPTFDADYYREAVLYRFIELVESSFQLYKSNQLIGSIVTARAAQETLAVAWYVNSKLELLCKNKDLSHFNDIIIRLTVGWSKDEEFPEKINVITCIEAVDKVLEGKFKRHYDMLSEYAHPNWSGTMGAFGSPNKDKLEVTFGKYLRSEETMKKHVESTLIICLKLLNSIDETYHEVINDALDVCHELHGKGKLKEQLK